MGKLVGGQRKLSEDTQEVGTSPAPFIIQGNPRVGEEDRRKVQESALQRTGRNTNSVLALVSPFHLSHVFPLPD